MSGYDFPELPSDDELGITDADREEYEKDIGDDRPEMSDAELAALLGESPVPKDRSAPKDAQPTPKHAKPDRKAIRAAKKQAKEAEKKARAATKRAKKAEKQAGAAKEQAAREAKAAADVKSEGATAKDASPTPPTPPKGEDTEPAAKPPRAKIEIGPRSRWRGAATLAALAALSAFGSTRTGLPRPGPANAPDTAFSSARAMATLVEIAREAHPTGSPEHARVREFLLDRLRTLGMEPEVQTATNVREYSGMVRSGTVRNIVARIPGTAPTGTVLITAHYDSREISVGAGDDGSGIVTIVEAIRALRAGAPLANDLVVLLTDAEELGLLGARAFVEQHEWMADVDLVLSFEMRGAGGPSIMFETNADGGWVVDGMKDFDSRPFANSMSYEVYKRIRRDTDFSPFRDAGIQGLNFATIDNAHVYHQASDTPENLSESSLQHHGIHALGALRHFGNADLSSVNAPTPVFFTIPGLGLIVYPQSLVLPISGGLLILLALAALVATRGGARPAAIAAGAAVFAMMAGAGYATAVALLNWLSGQHQEFGSLQGSAFHSEGWYVLALALAIVGTATGLTSVVRRWLSPAELVLGAVLLPTIGAVAISVAAPLAAMNLQWPVLAGLIAAVVVALLGDRTEGMVGWLVAVALCGPILLVLLPVIELLWLAMSIELLAVLAVLMVTCTFLCLPAVYGLLHPNGWWAPATILALSATSLGIGSLMARPSAARPAPSTLVYAYEHGSGSAIWATSPGDEAEARGRAWAAGAVSSGFPGLRDLSDFGYRPGDVPTAPAPILNASPPEVYVVSDSIFDQTRHVTLQVRSQIGAEMLAFRLEGGTRLTSINGVAISSPETVRLADHWGEPDGAVVLELTMPPTEPIGLHVLEHLFRPEEIVGPDVFARPADLAPNTNWMSDRAMFSYSIAAFIDPRHAIVAPPIRRDLLGSPRDAELGAPASRRETGRPDTGIPLDSVELRREMPPTDTSVGDSLVTDTLQATDTMVIDTAAVDTMVVDTMVVDTTLSSHRSPR